MAIQIFGSDFLGTIGADTESPTGFGFSYYYLAGSDVLTAPQGGTFLLGSGDDSLTAAYGALVIGASVIFGAEGNDTIVGGAQPEWAFGGTGDDSLTGGAGNDLLAGDALDFFLSFGRFFPVAFPLAGDDTIEGGDGDDLIIGGWGSDSLSGGNGSDVFVWGLEDLPGAGDNDFDDLVVQFEAGSGGDLLYFFDLIETTPSTAAEDHVRFVQQGADTLVQLNRDGVGDDWLDMVVLDDILAATLGASNVAGLRDGATLLPAIFTVIATEWADVLDIAQDTVDPDLLGYPLYTLGGDDQLMVSPLLGGFYGLGSGDDHFMVKPPDSSGGGFPGEFPGEEPPPGGFAFGVFVNGGSGKDTILGEAGRDMLTGGSGDDSLVGGDGVDQLFGDDFDVSVSIAGGLVSGWRYDASSPYLALAATVDGDDTLDGGAGGDLLIGGPGNDLITGGEDSDLFLFEPPLESAQWMGEEFGPITVLGVDTITDFEFGADGDRLFFDGLIDASTLPAFGESAYEAFIDLTDGTSNTLLWFDRDGTGPAAAELLAVLENTALQALHPNQLPGFGPSLNQPVPLLPLFDAVGTYWADTWELTDWASQDYYSFYLLDGDDSVSTSWYGTFSLGRGDDVFAPSPGAFLLGGFTVNGDQGDDSITGSSMLDSITGGSGSDWIDGGGGNDELRGDGFDVSAIRRDSGDAHMDYLQAGSSGGSDTILGGAGNDLIIGGQGIDDLDGGSGSDTFVYEHADEFGDLIRNFQPGSDRILINGLLMGLDVNTTQAVDAADFTVWRDALSVRQNGPDTELLVDLDGPGPDAPQIIAILVGLQANTVDPESVVVFGEEYREPPELPQPSDNQPPTAADDAIVATEDTLYEGTLPGADDPDGDPVTYALGAQASNGTVTFTGTDTFTYLPFDNFFGTDTFTYTVSDGNGGSNTYTVSIAVTGVVDTIVGTVGDDELVDDTGGPALLQGLAGDDRLAGDTGDDTLEGGLGNDTLIGGSGDDAMLGGAGIDVAEYPGNVAGYSLSNGTYKPGSGTTFNLTDDLADGGFDTLEGVDRLSFADGKLAVDFWNADGSAGPAATVAKILGAVFGPAAVANEEYAGIGLYYLDEQGFAYPELMQLALEARLGPGFSNQQMVVLLYQNIAGVAPDAATVAFYSGLIGSVDFPTQTALATYAADLPETAWAINLAGLQQSGLAYEPFVV